ncbi:MAG: glycosyltransferase family 2 protein [Paenibacillaceae bacterium]|jgi:dolichol-phosphate mannosyltransferase|nr:glycosyltransferase family 2 protein [Paenibacillaceae bacterium]
MNISIIVPSRNEGKNVELLTQRILEAVPPEYRYEIWFIDDSNDDTPKRLAQLAKRYSFVHYLHRVNGTGLSTAILEGFQQAAGDWFIVMDADLQHPPQSLPGLMAALTAQDADIVIPSRFIPGGHDGGLSLPRKLVSWTARMMARLSLRRVRKISDPTSGYFAVRRKTAFSRPLDPIGWKILLELLVRSDYTGVREIPYTFEARDLGSSKFNMKEQWNYIRHLGRLIASSEADYRFWKFCLVGASGVVVNSAVYVPMVKAGVDISLSFVTATVVATVNNFAWNNRFTWNHLKQDRLWYRMFKFGLVSLSGLALSGLSVEACHRFLGLHYLLSGFIGILVSTGWNFVFNSLWTFKKRSNEPGTNPVQGIEL